MRIDKAIENIQAAIDRHQDEWLKANGYEPEPHVRKPRAESQAKSAKKIPSASLPANRFLGSSTDEKGSEVEVVEVIKQTDQHHSWLYNEVLKAINDAIGNRKNAKVVAVFIPVVQNGSEFKDLPVNEAITLSEVSEEDITPEISAAILEQEPEESESQTEQEEPELQLEPEEQSEQEELEAEETSEEEILLPSPEEESGEPEAMPDAIEEIMIDSPVEDIEESEEPAEIEEPATDEEPTAEDDLLENVMLEPHEEEEIAEIFGDMEEKLDEQLQETEEIPETLTEPESESEPVVLEELEEFPEDENFDDGEKLNFDEIPFSSDLPDLSEMPELDDDEVFEETDPEEKDPEA